MVQQHQQQSPRRLETLCRVALTSWELREFKKKKRQLIFSQNWFAKQQKVPLEAQVHTSVERTTVKHTKVKCWHEHGWKAGSWYHCYLPGFLSVYFLGDPPHYLMSVHRTGKCSLIPAFQYCKFRHDTFINTKKNTTTQKTCHKTRRQERKPLKLQWQLF